jgi:hypothetical protein
LIKEVKKEITFDEHLWKEESEWMATLFGEDDGEKGDDWLGEEGLLFQQ